MVVRVGIVKLVLGIAGLIAVVQILVIVRFSSLQSNDVNLKFRKSITSLEYKDSLGPNVLNGHKAIDVFGGKVAQPLENMQVRSRCNLTVSY